MHFAEPGKLHRNPGVWGTRRFVARRLPMVTLLELSQDAWPRYAISESALGWVDSTNVVAFFRKRALRKEIADGHAP